MNRYYIIDPLSELGFIELTEAEYENQLKEIKQKIILAIKLYNEEIRMDEIPIELQEEIQTKVNNWVILTGNSSELPVSSNDFYSMIEEVL